MPITDMPNNEKLPITTGALSALISKVRSDPTYDPALNAPIPTQAWYSVATAGPQRALMQQQARQSVVNTEESAQRIANYQFERAEKEQAIRARKAAVDLVNAMKTTGIGGPLHGYFDWKEQEVPYPQDAWDPSFGQNPEGLLTKTLTQEPYSGPRFVDTTNIESRERQARAQQGNIRKAQDRIDSIMDLLITGGEFGGVSIPPGIMYYLTDQQRSEVLDALGRTVLPGGVDSNMLYGPDPSGTAFRKYLEERFSRVAPSYLPTENTSGTVGDLDVVPVLQHYPGGVRFSGAPGS